MKTVSPDAPSPRIVMFGLRCAFTDAVAAGLTLRGLPPTALLVSGHPKLERPVRVGAPRTSLPIAGASVERPESRLPTFQVGQLTSLQTIELVRSLQPDVVVVACFPRLVPRVVREIARCTAINVHPSLLPAHRGPDPLFWIMRDGGAGCGVTVHELSDGYDTGDILAQRAVPYPEGARETDLERRLAGVGADLVAWIVMELSAGNELRRQQNEETATYESWPDVDDHVISIDRPVQDAWNFVRGVAGRGVPVRIVGGPEEVVVSDAVELVQGSTPPVASNAGEVVLRFRNGWLLALEHRPFTG